MFLVLMKIIMVMDTDMDIYTIVNQPHQIILVMKKYNKLNVYKCYFGDI